MPDSPQVERCPTCESDDPAKSKYPFRHGIYPDGCPDPWHHSPRVDKGEHVGDGDSELELRAALSSYQQRIEEVVTERNREVDLRREREQRISELEGALERAADDLGKAANQFEAIKASQDQGHIVLIDANPSIFAEKERQARSTLTEKNDA